MRHPRHKSVRGASLAILKMCVFGDMLRRIIFVNICEDSSISIPFSISIFAFQIFDPGNHAYSEVTHLVERRSSGGIEKE